MLPAPSEPAKGQAQSARKRAPWQNPKGRVSAPETQPNGARRKDEANKKPFKRKENKGKENDEVVDDLIMRLLRSQKGVSYVNERDQAV